MTYDERLSALEKHTNTTNENLTILLGTIGAQGADIKRLVLLAEQHSEQLNHITDTLVRAIGRLDAQGTLLQRHSEVLRQILARLPEQS